MKAKSKFLSLVGFAVVFLSLSLFLDYGPFNIVKAAAFEELVWVNTPGGTALDTGSYTDVDSSGNVYSISYIGAGDSIDFDEDNVTAGDTHTSAGARDIAISKYNSNGVFQWVKVLGSTTADEGYGISVDGSDNIIAVGVFSGTVDFDEDNVVAGDTATSDGPSWDFFIAKYNSSGVLQWLKALGGSEGDFGYGVATDSSNNIYVTGNVYESIDYDEDNVVAGDTKGTVGTFALFTAKYNSSGVLQWVKSIDDGGIGYGIHADSSGNVYSSSYFTGSGVDFDDDNVVAGDTHTSTGGSDIEISKYNSSGVLQWVKALGGTSNDSGFGITTDGSGNVYVAGRFFNTVDFDEDNVVSGDTHTSVGGYDTFLAKYNSGGTLQWVKANGGTGHDFAYGVDLDNAGNVYVAGQFAGTSIDFDEDNVVSGDTQTSSGSSDIFVAKYSTSGVIQWVKALGTSGGDSAISVHVDASNNVYLDGGFSGSNVDFDEENIVSGDTHTSAGNKDIFIAKYRQFEATRIENLNSGLAATDQGTSSSAESYNETFTSGTRMIRVAGSTGLIIGDIDTDMSADLDWSSVTGNSKISSGVAFVHNLTSAAGTAATFTLYVPKQPTHSSVTICPGASSFAELIPGCASEVVKTEADGDTSIVNIAGQDYWAIIGMTGTGGFGSGVENIPYIDLDAQPATAPSTISTAPEVAISTADNFYMSYIPTTTEFAASDFVDVVIPFDWSGLAVCAATGDADGVGGNDHTVAVIDNQIIRYTFTGVTTTALATGVEFCFTATTIGTPGNYSIAISDTNDGDYGPALIYVGDDNDVTLTATIPLTLSLRIKEPSTTVDTNVCALGVLNPGSVNSCSYRIAAGTNISTGMKVFIFADNQLNTAGDAADIDDVAGGAIVTAGVEEHGVLVTLGTGWTVGGSFSASTDEVMPLAETLILDAAAAISDSIEANWNTITHSASVNSGTSGGSYDQLVTYRAWVDT